MSAGSRFLVALLLVVVVGSTVPVFAAAAATAGSGSLLQEPDEHAPQEGENLAEEEHALEAKEWWHWPSKWINFLALVALLYWLLVVPPAAIQDIFSFPGLRVVFQERGAGILAARALAAEQQQEARQLLADSEQRLAKIDVEVAALVTDAEKDAEREHLRAAEDGKVQAQKIREVAEREVRHQQVGAQRQLRSFVAGLAVSMAEKNLAEHLTAEDQDRLIRDYLARLGGSMA